MAPKKQSAPAEAAVAPKKTKPKDEAPKEREFVTVGSQQFVRIAGRLMPLRPRNVR